MNPEYLLEGNSRSINGSKITVLQRYTFSLRLQANPFVSSHYVINIVIYPILA